MISDFFTERVLAVERIARQVELDDPRLPKQPKTPSAFGIAGQGHDVPQLFCGKQRAESFPHREQQIIEVQVRWKDRS